MQPNSFNCWDRDRMSVPKSKNPKIKNKNKNKIYNINIYYSRPRCVCIPLFLRPVGVNKPWRDGWMTGWMDKWMKWCFTTSFIICNWGRNKEYKSQCTQFLSLMATLKLGMKQGLQESRYPHFSHSWLHSNWGWNREYKNQGAQYYNPKTWWCNGKLFIYMQNVWYSKKCPWSSAKEIS